MSAPTGIGTGDLRSNPRYLFRQPRALQWFDNGRLVKRHDSERAAGRTTPPRVIQSCKLTNYRRRPLRTLPRFALRRDALELCGFSCGGYLGRKACQVHCETRSKRNLHHILKESIY